MTNLSVAGPLRRERCTAVRRLTIPALGRVLARGDRELGPAHGPEHMAWRATRTSRIVARKRSDWRPRLAMGVILPGLVFLTFRVAAVLADV
jgi:hypothetical protein